MHLPSSFQGGGERCDPLELDVVKIFDLSCPHHLHETKCALRLITQIEEWLKKNNKYRILLTGKMGTGKTTLIKGLKENYVPENQSLLPHTKIVTPYNFDREGFNFILFDTPGLEDTEDSSHDLEYINDMVKKSRKPDLIIFAVKMSDTFRDEDTNAIVNISNAFGWKVWENAMFVLTNANMVTKVGYSPESIESKLHFSTTYNEHYYSITNILRSNRVHEDIVNSISVIPVGLVSQPKITSDIRDVSWIDELWENAFKVLKASRKTVEETLETHEESKSSSWWSFLT